MCKSCNSPGAEPGFTLLEVLVALAVVAIALGAIIKATGETARNTAYLRDKTFAEWVALNRLAELQATGEWPPTGTRSGEEEMGGAIWAWTRIVAESGQPGVRRVEVEVGRDGGSSEPLVTVTGFVVEQLLTTPEGGGRR